jgi:hypothetical protein
MSVAGIIDPTTGIIETQYLPPTHTAVQTITAGTGITVAGSVTTPIVSTNLLAGNGITLTPSAPTAITIASTGSFSSPLSVVSPDTTKTLTITQADSGVATIANNNAISLTSPTSVPGSASTGVSIVATTAGGNAGLLLQNAESPPAGYEFLVGGTSGGGVATNNFQLFTYSGGGFQGKVIDATNNAKSITLANDCLQLTTLDANNNIQIVGRASGSLRGLINIASGKPYYNENYVDDLTGVDWTFYNSYNIARFAKPGHFTNITLDGTSDFVPLGTEINVYPSSIGFDSDGVQFLYNAVVMPGGNWGTPSANPGNWDKLYRYIKVNTTNTTADWLQVA